MGNQSLSDLFLCRRRQNQKVEPVQVRMAVTCGFANGQHLTPGQKPLAAKRYHAWSEQGRRLSSNCFQQRRHCEQRIRSINWTPGSCITVFVRLLMIACLWTRLSVAVEAKGSSNSAGAEVFASMVCSGLRFWSSS